MVMLKMASSTSGPLIFHVKVDLFKGYTRLLVRDVHGGHVGANRAFGDNILPVYLQIPNLPRICELELRRQNVTRISKYENGRFGWPGLSGAYKYLNLLLT